ncbi:unnamed protein product [Musa textilis]
MVFIINVVKTQDYQLLIDLKICSTIYLDLCSKFWSDLCNQCVYQALSVVGIMDFIRSINTIIEYYPSLVIYVEVDDVHFTGCHKQRLHRIERFYPISKFLNLFT